MKSKFAIKIIITRPLAWDSLRWCVGIVAPLVADILTNEVPPSKACHKIFQETIMSVPM